jgi:NAD(P)-dependent dehydrogenase (short-subunit alcohol dehydrogenase family)
VELNGRTVLVTGGARRIGRAVCLALAQRGARVAIHCNESEDEARETARQCPGSVVVSADLRNLDAAAQVLEEVEQRCGGIDVLVNNASVYEARDPAEIDEEAWDRALEVNLKAPFFLARDCAMRMRGRGGGVIVNLTDALVGQPYPRYLPYFAAKAGLEAATKGLAKAFAPEVRVNAVAPGPVLLPDGSDAGYEAQVRAATPLGRIGGPDAIVSAVIFLILNDFVTGASLRVDGGRSIR